MVAKASSTISPQLDDYLKLKKRARRLSDTEFVMGVAESVALGASCLDDLAVNRADAAQAQLRGFEIPAPQTAGRGSGASPSATSAS